MFVPGHQPFGQPVQQRRRQRALFARLDRRCRSRGRRVANRHRTGTRHARGRRQRLRVDVLQFDVASGRLCRARARFLGRAQDAACADAIPIALVAILTRGTVGQRAGACVADLTGSEMEWDNARCCEAWVSGVTIGPCEDSTRWCPVDGDARVTGSVPARWLGRKRKPMRRR